MAWQFTLAETDEAPNTKMQISIDAANVEEDLKIPIGFAMKCNATKPNPRKSPPPNNGQAAATKARLRALSLIARPREVGQITRRALFHRPSPKSFTVKDLSMRSRRPSSTPLWNLKLGRYIGNIPLDGGPRRQRRIALGHYGRRGCEPLELAGVDSPRSTALRIAGALRSAVCEAWRSTGRQPLRAP
jgi:hypothetical protein